MIRTATVLALVTLLVTPAAAQFSGSRLFVNHSVRHQMDRTVGIGADLTVAPVRAAQKKLVEGFREEYPQESEIVMQAAQYVDPEDIRDADPDELLRLIKEKAPLTAQEEAQLDQAFSDLRAAGVDQNMMADLFEIMTEPDTAITFSFEPHVWLHFDLADVYFTLPVAGFFGDETEFALGNFGIDGRFGHVWGEGVAFGLTYGLQYWAPTATTRANALGLANLVWAPRYFSEYTTVAPYLVLGADLYAVTLQASVAYSAMFGVKGTPDHDQIQYLQYGGSLSITAIPMVVISAELSGLAPVENAAAWDALYLTAGLRFVNRFLDLGIGAQVPLVVGGSDEFAPVSGVSFGSPGDWNLIVSLTFGV